MSQRVPGADRRVLVAGQGGAARQALRILLVAGFAGLLLGSAPLKQWAEPVPLLGPAAARWDALMTRVGLDRPYAALRAAARRLEGEGARS